MGSSITERQRIKAHTSDNGIAICWSSKAVCIPWINVLISYSKAASLYTNRYFLWRGDSATPDLRLRSQSQNVTALGPIPNCTARWQRHSCMNELPRVAADRKSSAINKYATELHQLGRRLDHIRIRSGFDPDLFQYMLTLPNPAQHSQRFIGHEPRATISPTRHAKLNHA